MKLYQAPRHSKIRIKFDGGDGKTSEEILDFDHIDGAYSLCYDQTGHPVHVAAWTEVEVIDDTGSKS